MAFVFFIFEVQALGKMVPIWQQAWFWGCVVLGGLITFLTHRLVLRGRTLRKAHVALEAAHLDLERHVQLRTSELAETNKLLQQEMYERKQAEKELVRLERLRALAELSAGVSHNMNNLLTGILGPAELMQGSDDQEKSNIYLDMIVKSSLRMAEVVERLRLSVATDSLDDIGKTCIETAIVSAIDMTRPRWKDEAESKGIAISVQTDLAKTPSISANEVELRNVLINLIFNAIDALPEGGEIRFKTWAQDQHVILSVEDTGMGMDDKILARVFDPFFTTKMDVGSGLGLSMVRGTLRRWGAAVGVESQLGVGSTFTLTLPVWKEDFVSKSLDVAVPDVVPRKRVLVVDDEDVVLRIIQNALQVHHDVDVALSGEEGLALFEQTPYDLVLIDLGMPHMPGDQVAKVIKKKNAQVMTLLVTGWDLDPNDDRLAWFDGVMTKPFGTLAALRDVVAQMAIAHEERMT
jgi:signal transduction histidine kinase